MLPEAAGLLVAHQQWPRLPSCQYLLFPCLLPPLPTPAYPCVRAIPLSAVSRPSPLTTDIWRTNELYVYIQFPASIPAALPLKANIPVSYQHSVALAEPSHRQRSKRTESQQRMSGRTAASAAHIFPGYRAESGSVLFLYWARYLVATDSACRPYPGYLLVYLVVHQRCLVDGTCLPVLVFPILCWPAKSCCRVRKVHSVSIQTS